MIFDYSVSFNITAHREGYLLHKTLKSIAANQKYALENGVPSIEINIHLDNSDITTRLIAERFCSKNLSASLYHNSFGDSSVSRNFLIDKCKGKYVIFFDGDDFFTENFVAEAYRLSELYKLPTIYSAEYIIDFNNSINNRIYTVESTVELPARKTVFFENNLYISQNFVHSSIYRQIKYLPTAAIYGFEDWQWNTQVINAGFDFQVVPGTLFFYRKKDGAASLLNIHSKLVLEHTPLFEPKNFIKLDHIVYTSPSAPVKMRAKEPVRKNINPQLAGKYLQLIFKTDSLTYRSIKKFYLIFRILINPLVFQYYDKLARPTAVSAEDTIIELELAEVKKLTSTHLNYWSRLNQYEPILRPSKEVIGSLLLLRYADEHAMATTYYRFCKLFVDKQFDDIIFVPWLQIGGADLAIIDLARTASRAGRKVLIVTTSGIDSALKKQTSAIKNVSFMESHVFFKELDHKNFKLFFLRVLQNWKIKTVTIMNSAIGFELIELYGKYVPEDCRIIIHNYAIPTDREGFLVEAFTGFSGSLQYAFKIIVDSIAHQNLISDVYGVSNEKITVVPLMMSKGLKKKSAGLTRKIVYANRLAREKQPDVAIRVADMLSPLGVAIDIYGTKDEVYCDSIGFDELVQNSPNVFYKKSFQGIESLDFNRYDICLLTSLYEGIPRIALEAVKANVFVICADVGGLSEIIIDGQNGFLIKQNCSPEDYALKIRQYYETPELQDLVKRKRASMLVVAQHSQDTYDKQIHAMYNLEDSGRKNG